MLATIVASIELNGVAIIAGFAVVNDAVAAGRRLVAGKAESN